MDAYIDITEGIKPRAERFAAWCNAEERKRREREAAATSPAVPCELNPAHAATTFGNGVPLCESCNARYLRTLAA